jgi:aminoglycoside phosphotransferase (APT) family kinase protein
LITYPRIPKEQQAGLPQLIGLPNALPVSFEDSTHQLWHCHTEDGDMVLKVCNKEVMTKSAFWLGMNALFAADFPSSLGEMDKTYTFLTAHSPLLIPRFVASSKNSFVLTAFLTGVDMSADSVSEQQVIKLALHLAQLHQQTYSTWGHLHRPNFERAKWSNRLVSTLTMLAEQQGLINHIQVKQAIEQAKEITPSYCVPIMPDLRWDQFRVDNQGRLALMDLDAFVIGPRELELVLLEYILEEPHYSVFKKTYQTVLDYPDLTMVRLSYQVLLFAMNVLGETDLEKWLS